MIERKEPPPCGDTGGKRMQGKDGKYIFGLAKVGEKGQIVIPQEARKIFGIQPGDSLLILGDIEQGLAIVRPDVLENFAASVMDNKRKEDPEDKA